MHSKNSIPTAAPSVIQWEEKGESRSALWRSESGIAPPKRVVIGDDQMTADSAYRLACEGTAFGETAHCLTKMGPKSRIHPRLVGTT